MAGLCEGGNEPPGSLKASKFFDRRLDEKSLKKGDIKPAVKRPELVSRIRLEHYKKGSVMAQAALFHPFLIGSRE
ncbi:hypothetical protein ANN_20929 [Periplaneta americana]|uniref:Uncharacterized protein n=1 Tax=Periplaneta americana TaxID=6978 RepID=A0ABQ8SE40_PERAM|nr:hypothetical protein ANN_20929 [Periplaneta americana]